MITLLAIGALTLISCLAAAGLIASTQKQTLDARTVADPEEVRIQL